MKLVPLIALALIACGDGVAREPAYPLFDLSAVQTACAATTAEFLAREPAQRKSTIPPGIDWAENIDAAIERATRERKPIFLVTHVRAFPNLERNPDCEV